MFTKIWTGCCSFQHPTKMELKGMLEIVWMVFRDGESNRSCVYSLVMSYQSQNALSAPSFCTLRDLCAFQISAKCAFYSFIFYLSCSLSSKYLAATTLASFFSAASSISFCNLMPFSFTYICRSSSSFVRACLFLNFWMMISRSGSEGPPFVAW